MQTSGATTLNGPRVAVIGGGVTGLTCAIPLMKDGVDVHVYEAASQFGEIGAGLGVGSNATQILQDLGLLDDVLARGDHFHTQWFQYVSGLGDHEVMHEMSLEPGQQPFMVHRAAFLDALVRHVDMSRVHFNKRCTGVSDDFISPRPTIHFADGTSATADVVIGADGIKSVVRGAVTGADPSESVKFSQGYVYRGVVPIEAVKAAGVKTDLVQRPICFIGPKRHLIIFGINAGKLINVVAWGSNQQIPPDEWKDHPLREPAVVDATTEEVLAEYEGWGNDVQGLLGCIKQPSKWNINVVYPPLKSYVRGRVALVGDAAHAMQPHLGAGAGQGIEDAYLLSKLLSHPQTTSANVETILRVYDEIRRPRVNRVWNDSYLMGDITDGLGEHGATPEGLRKDIEGMWDYTWSWKVGDEVKQAERALAELGAYRLAHL